MRFFLIFFSICLYFLTSSTLPLCWYKDVFSTLFYIFIFLPYSLFSQFAPKNTRPQKHYNNIIFIDFLVKSSQSTSKVIDTFSLRTKYFFFKYYYFFSCWISTYDTNEESQDIILIESTNYFTFEFLVLKIYSFLDSQMRQRTECQINNVKEKSIILNNDVVGNIFKQKKQIEKRQKGVQLYLDRVDYIPHVHLENNFNLNTITFSTKKKCIGTKSQGNNGSNLETETLLSSIPKPLSEEREIESTIFNFQMVSGQMIVLSSKMKLNIIFKTFSAATSMIITTHFLKVPTPSLMILVSFCKIAPSLKLKF